MSLTQSCLEHNAMHRNALVCDRTGRSVTYDMLSTQVEFVVGELRKIGVQFGMRVCLAIPPSIEFVVGLLAARSLGAAVAPIDTSLKGETLAASVGSLEPHVVVTSGRSSPHMRKLPSVLGKVVTLAQVGATTVDFAVEDRPRLPETMAFQDPKYQAALLISTSGTTGVPKYVRMSEKGTLFNIRAHLRSFEFDGFMTNLQVLNTNFSYGCIASLLGTLVNGGTLVFPTRLDASGIAESVQKHRPDTLYLSAALAAYLIDAAPENACQWFQSVTRIGVGGDVTPLEIRRKIAGAFPDADVFITYGVTEAGPRVSTLQSHDLINHAVSVGPPLEGVTVKVVDDAGAEVPQGSVGRLIITTPSAMLGYLGAEPVNTTAVEPGDLASLDAEGRLTLHGRFDRQVKLRGERIHPHQIELLIAQVAGVKSAFVSLSKRGDRLGARVFVDATPSATLTDEIRTHCRKNIPSRHVPVTFELIEDTAYYFKGRRIAALEAN